MRGFGKNAGIMNGKVVVLILIFVLIFGVVYFNWGDNSEKVIEEDGSDEEVEEGDKESEEDSSKGEGVKKKAEEGTDIIKKGVDESGVELEKGGPWDYVSHYFGKGVNYTEEKFGWFVGLNEFDGKDITLLSYVGFGDDQTFTSAPVWNSIFFGLLVSGWLFIFYIIFYTMSYFQFHSSNFVGLRSNAPILSTGSYVQKYFKKDGIVSLFKDNQWKFYWYLIIFPLLGFFPVTNRIVQWIFMLEILGIWVFYRSMIVGAALVFGPIYMAKYSSYKARQRAYKYKLREQAEKEEARVQLG